MREDAVERKLPFPFPRLARAGLLGAATVAGPAWSSSRLALHTDYGVTCVLASVS